MIVSFYNNEFKGLQNNASLVVDKSSYKLIKRPVDMNELSCVCEAFTENIQPTFLVVKDDKGGYIYGSLAGVPLLNKDNQTEINGTDLKSMLSSDVVLEFGTYTTVNEIITYIFNQWVNQVNQNSIPCELVFNENVGTINTTELIPTSEKKVYNAWDVLQTYLKYYDLYLDTFIDLINKKVQFIVGKTMFRQQNIKLWEYGIRNYGKWVADTNECQGYYIDENNNWNPVLDSNNNEITWILTSDNNITTDKTKRDIYPIKRRVVTSSTSIQEALSESLTTLLDSLYNENIDIDATLLNPTFETRFAIYVNKGENKYKDLPCGELHYDSSGLTKFQIGYRYSNINFI